MTAADLDIGWLLAFSAGLLSFLSPCVAPLVPGYLSFLSGSPGVGAAASRGELERVLTVSMLFVLGFSAVFVGPRRQRSSVWRRPGGVPGRSSIGSRACS